MSEMTKPRDYVDRECCPRCGEPERGGWCEDCQPLDRDWLGVDRDQAGVLPQGGEQS